MVRWLKPSGFMRGMAGICRICSGFCGRCTYGAVPENRPAYGYYLNIYRICSSNGTPATSWSQFSSGSPSPLCPAYALPFSAGRLKQKSQAASNPLGRQTEGRFLNSRRFLRLLLPSDGSRSSKTARYPQTPGPCGALAWGMASGRVPSL